MTQPIPEEDQARINEFLAQEASRARPKKHLETETNRPPRKVRGLLNLAQQKGLEVREGKGSHRVIVNPITHKCMPIPVHDEGDELGKGLASKICDFITGKK